LAGFPARPQEDLSSCTSWPLGHLSRRSVYWRHELRIQDVLPPDQLPIPPAPGRAPGTPKTNRSPAKVAPKLCVVYCFSCAVSCSVFFFLAFQSCRPPSARATFPFVPRPPSIDRVKSFRQVPDAPPPTGVVFFYCRGRSFSHVFISLARLLLLEIPDPQRGFLIFVSSPPLP